MTKIFSLAEYEALPDDKIPSGNASPKVADQTRLLNSVRRLRSFERQDERPTLQPWRPWLILKNVVTFTQFPCKEHPGAGTRTPNSSCGQNCQGPIVPFTDIPNERETRRIIEGQSSRHIQLTSHLVRNSVLYVQFIASAASHTSIEAVLSRHCWRRLRELSLMLLCHLFIGPKHRPPHFCPKLSSWRDTAAVDKCHSLALEGSPITRFIRPTRFQPFERVTRVFGPAHHSLHSHGLVPRRWPLCYI